MGLISSVVGQFTTVARATDYADTDNGKLYYLDRHDVRCSAGEAIRSFKLQRKDRESDEVRYYLDCVSTGSINKNEIKTESTAYHNAWWWSSKCLQYLQYHNIVCSDGYVLKSFRQGRSGDQLNYSYSCVRAQTLGCKHYETHLNDIGTKQVWYLDRHYVGSGDSDAWVLKSFKLEVIGSQIRYSGEKCKLKDMDAIRALEDSRDALNETNDNLRLEKVELTNITKQVNLNTEQQKEANQKFVSATDKRNKSQEKLEEAKVFEADNQKTYDEDKEKYDNAKQESKLSENFLKSSQEQLINNVESNSNADAELEEANEALKMSHDHIKISQQELSHANEEYNTSLNNISDLENNLQEKEKEQQLQHSTVEDDKKNFEDCKIRIANLNENQDSANTDIKLSAEVIVNTKSSISENKEFLKKSETELEELRRKVKETEAIVKEAGEILKLSEEISK